MKKILFSLLLINTFTVNAQDMQIKINQEQIDHLDIKIGKLTKSSLVPLLYAPAKVVLPADKEVLISSSQPGTVVQLLANIGDKVKKDEVLAKINSSQLVTLQREFLTAKSELNLADQEYNRDKKLLEEGVIADRHWQETQSIHSSKSALYDTSRQLLVMAGMSVSEIKLLANSGKLSSLLNVHAPISGVVMERSTAVGARIDVQAPLYRIADLSELWLEINIPQERINTIAIGDQVKVEGSSVTAKINLLGQSVNQENQTVLARAIIDGRQPQVRAGQNVNVQITQKNEQNVFKVSNTAIAQNAGHDYIFVRNTDGFMVTEIKVVGKQDSESLIYTSLSDKDQIAVKGAAALKANWLGLGADE